MPSRMPPRPAAPLQRLIAAVLMAAAVALAGHVALARSARSALDGGGGPLQQPTVVTFTPRPATPTPVPATPVARPDLAIGGLEVVVARHDVQTLASPATRPLFQRPVRALVPLVSPFGADDPGKVHALETREAARRLDGKVGAQCGVAAGDAAGLRTFLAQDARQLAGVDPGDSDCVPAAQELRQGFGGTPAGMQQWQVTDHETGGMDEARLVVVGVGAGVADVRVGQRDDLPGIRRVGQDFLVARHGGVEHHLAGRRAGGANGNAAKHSAVL